MVSPARGICPACGEDRALRRDGTMRTHLHGVGRDYYHQRGRCPGVNQKPIRVTK